MNKRLLTFLLCVGFVVVAGCSAGFKAIKEFKPQGETVTQYRGSPSGNQVIESPTPLLDTLLYERKLNGAIGAQVIGNEQLIVVPTFNQRIYFIDPNTGKEISYIRTKAPMSSAAAIAGDKVYYVEEAGSDKITCQSITSGKMVWSFKLVDPQGAPIIQGNAIYITSRMGKLYKLDLENGKVIWKFESNSQFYAAPAISGDRVIVGTDKGELISIDLATGKQQWSFKTDRPIFSQPLADDRIYFGSGDGSMYAVDTASGKLVWSFKTPFAIHSTPSIANGRLVFGSDDKFIYCLDPLDGKLLWKYGTESIIQSSPIFLANTILIGNSAGVIYQFAENGKFIKSEKVKGSITAPFTVIGDKLFVATRGRYLYAYKLAKQQQAD